MSAQGPHGLDEDLLNEFFSEADEHLNNIRNTLMDWERETGADGLEVKEFNELFQNFHSFKGISAIAGLKAAEEIAHTVEDYLRLLQSGKADNTQAAVAAVVDATQKLVEIVNAFRLKKPLPDCSDLLSELKLEIDRSSIRADVETDQVQEESRNSSSGGNEKTLWKIRFSPAQAMDAKGINLNSIRHDLSSVGIIKNSEPIVTGDGVIFEFLLETHGEIGSLKAFVDKGLLVTRVVKVDEENDSTDLRSAQETHTPFLAPSHIVRVDLNRLDDLMRIAAEMVIHRSRLETQLAILGQTANGRMREVLETNTSLGKSLRQLREAILAVRLIPVAEIFRRMAFVVRDLETQTGHKANLKLEGEDTLIDKYVIEKLKDPILHLVRNIFGHGIDTVEQRRAAKKEDEATIILSAKAVGDSVLVSVGDDGRGVDFDKVVERARKIGLGIPKVVDEAAILRLLCEPGFSTREEADKTSGRGMGMSIVNDAVRELGGHLTLQSKPNNGTTFTLRFPLTLSVLESIVVTGGGQTCALPQSHIAEIVMVTPEELQTANRIEVIRYREGVLPVSFLSDLFKLNRKNGLKLNMLVVCSERGSIGLLVDKVLGQKEIVVSPLRDPLLQVPGVAGATELGDGKPVMILDCSWLTSGPVKPARKELLNSEAKGASY